MNCYILKQKTLLIEVTNNKDFTTYFILDCENDFKQIGSKIFLGEDNEYRIIMADPSFLKTIGPIEYYTQYDLVDIYDVSDRHCKKHAYQIGTNNNNVIVIETGKKEKQEKHEVNFCPVCGYDIVERSKGWYRHYRCKLCGKTFDVKVR